MSEDNSEYKSASDSVAKSASEDESQKSRSSRHRNKSTRERKHREVDDDILRKQIHKWGQSHDIPAWAEEKLLEHLKKEKGRKEQTTRNSTWSCSNLIKPWRWCRIWHQRLIHKTDIEFPIDDDDELTLHKDDVEGLSTEVLVDEILDDDSEPRIGGDNVGLERNGVEPVDHWNPIGQLLHRDQLFTKIKIKENTKRSVALSQSKSSDGIPGATELTSEKNMSFKTEMWHSTYNKKTNEILRSRIENIEKHQH